ncbi:hypothetical protein VNO80_19236 [Phaseolus coccineus]|uniref:Uncharacterized protein n=1 Tax=Phaseolus coccineus TaxID=3886 RepID=A0AAN9MJ54_PHACN
MFSSVDSVIVDSETNLIEQLSSAGLKSGKEVRVGVGLDEGVMDMCGDDKMVLFHVRDVSGYLDGGRRKAIVDERGAYWPRRLARMSMMRLAGGGLG